MKANAYQLKDFLIVNMNECGVYANSDVVLLIANLVMDYLALQGFEIDEE